MSTLSDTKIRSLKPKDKPYKTFDYDGLFVLTTPKGSKLWRLKYRWQGREKLLSLGKYPAVSLKQARANRDEARSQLAQGLDPSAVRKAKRSERLVAIEGTFERLAATLLEKKEKDGRAVATIKKTEWLQSMLCQDIGKMAISEISASDVLVPLKKVEAKGNYETALRMRSAAGEVFRYAIAQGLLDNDPTYGLKDALVRPQKVHRAAITDPLGVGALLLAIDDFEGQYATRIALQLIALTALRPGELRMAKWPEVNIEEAIWTIPAERAKMRRPHTSPLSRQALELLTELNGLTGWGSYLFPSVRSSQRCMSDNTLNAALRRMGFAKEEMTAHGFRAIFSTLANEAGRWNPDAIERALAHVEQNEVRRAYARGAHWEERRELAQWWADYLDELRVRARQP